MGGWIACEGPLKYLILLSFLQTQYLVEVDLMNHQIIPVCDSACSSQSTIPKLPSDLSQDKMGSLCSQTFHFQISFIIGLGQLGYFKPAGTMITPG